MTAELLEAPARREEPRATARSAGRRLWGVVATCALAIGVGSAIFTVWAVFRLHVDLLTWDAWYTETDARLILGRHYGLADITRQHNEHRIAFPRLVFAADILFFHMSERLDLAASFALQAANAAILLRLVWRRVAEAWLRRLLAGFVVLVLFSLRQEQNFSNGFQVQFIGVFTAGMLAALALAEGLDRLGAANLPGPARPGGWPRLALAWFWCLVATYSMANGVMAGFALVMLALLVRAPWRPTLATLAVAVVLAAAFFHGYEKGGDSKPLSELVRHPWPYLSFLTAYLGNPLGDDVVLNRPLGAAGLFGIGWLAWRVVSGRERSTTTAALLGIAGFMLASAGATSFGRIALGAQQATEGRYATPSTLFWCALVAAAVPRPAAGLPARAGAVAVAALMALLAGTVVHFDRVAWPVMKGHAADIRRFRDSLWSGLYDKQAAAFEYNEKDFITSNLPFLHDHDLSLYDDPLPSSLGRPAASLGAEAPAEACSGTLARLQADPDLGENGARAGGTAWDVRADRPVAHVLAVDAGGRVIGFGSPDRVIGRNPDWTGFAAARPGTPVTFEAVLSDGRLCRIGTGEVAPP